MKNRFSDYIDKMPETGCAIVKDIRFTKPYLIVVPPFKTENISRDEVSDIMNPYLSHMHTKFEEAEKKAIKKANAIIAEMNKKSPPPKTKLKNLEKTMMPHTRKLLNLIAENQFAPKTELKTIAEMHDIKGKGFDKSLEWLKSQNLIKEIKIILKTSPSIFYPLTKDGYDLLKTPTKDRIYDRTFKHTYICVKIDEHLQAQGYETQREYSQGLDVNARIDVMAEKQGKKTAYEYTNTGFNYIEGTVHKCLIKMQMHALVIICDNQKLCQKAKDKIEGTSTLDKWKEQIKGKITYKTVRDFI